MAEKVIGVLGGMGPEATLSLYEEILRATPAAKDQEHLRVIIDSNPKVPDRTAAIMGRGESPVPEMVKSGLSLERAGADFIIVPCISAHFFLDQLRLELNLPIVSAFDETANRIKAGHPEIRTVGLLATRGTIHGGLFQRVLQEHWIDTVVPHGEDQERVMSAIYHIKASQAVEVKETCKEILVDVANHLTEMNAGGIVAGCTEIPLALFAKDISVPLFNPLSILAGAAVRIACG